MVMMLKITKSNEDTEAKFDEDLKKFVPFPVHVSLQNHLAHCSQSQGEKYAVKMQLKNQLACKRETMIAEDVYSQITFDRKCYEVVTLRIALSFISDDEESRTQQADSIDDLLRTDH